MNHMKSTVLALVVVISGMLVAAPALSQINIRVNPEHRDRHRTEYRHERSRVRVRAYHPDRRRVVIRSHQNHERVERPVNR